jgi:hypothetical protein
MLGCPGFVMALLLKDLGGKGSNSGNPFIIYSEKSHQKKIPEIDCFLPSSQQNPNKYPIK